MPGFDRSGPMGAGPMTGGRRGLCSPANTGYDTRFGGMFGFGRGMGRAFGWCGWNQPSHYPTYAQNPEEELNMLKAEANSVKNSLDTINRRIAELERSSE
jgi:hypothetical protein